MLPTPNPQRPDLRRIQVLLTDRFAEGLMLLRNMFRWHLIDMSYIVLNQTSTRVGGRKGQEARKLGAQVHRPVFDELSIEVRHMLYYLYIYICSIRDVVHSVSAVDIARRKYMFELQWPSSFALLPFARTLGSSFLIGTRHRRLSAQNYRAPATLPYIRSYFVYIPIQQT